MMALDLRNREAPPRRSARSLSCAARLAFRAYAYALKGDNRRALNAFIEAADQCLGMVWWHIMAAGEASSGDPTDISRMRRALRRFKAP